MIAAATEALAEIAACAPGSIAARSVRPLQSDVDSTVTVVTAASAVASIAIVDSVLGLSELQLVVAPDELMFDIDELLSGIDADADADAEALTSGVLTLGSLTALIPVGLSIPLLAGRTLGEEAELRKGLPGYIDYTKRVRWRWLPLVW